MANSPCIGYCRVGSENICLGCGRTLDEIVRWSTMTEYEQHCILLRLNHEQEQAQPQGGEPNAPKDAS